MLNLHSVLAVSLVLTTTICAQAQGLGQLTPSLPTPQTENPIKTKGTKNSSELPPVIHQVASAQKNKEPISIPDPKVSAKIGASMDSAWEQSNPGLLAVGGTPSPTGAGSANQPPVPGPLTPSFPAQALRTMLNPQESVDAARSPRTKIALPALSNMQRNEVERSAAFFAHHSKSLGLNLSHPAAIKALELLGTPYKWGSADEVDGMDCSGFALVAYSEAGFTLPRTSLAMSRALPTTNVHQLSPGDLVFFNTRGFAFSHVGVYLGKNLFAHAPRTGTRARIDEMTTPYWMKRFSGARKAPAHAHANGALKPMNMTESESNSLRVVKTNFQP